MVAGFAVVVYAREHRRAHEALRNELRLRANTLADALELGREGLELEVSARATPEYEKPGSGAYAVICDPTGKPVRKSPSLGDHPFPIDAPWVKDEFRFEELENGPDGFPCAAATLSFLVRVEKSKKSDWVPPPEAGRRYQIRVALDSRERDAGLAALAVFLAIAGAGALGVTVVGGLLLARRVLRPLRRMTEEAARLTPADSGRRLGPDTVVRELHSLATTLNSALDRLGDALERQRRFTSDAGHELRTPVSVLLGNAELLLRKPRSGEEYREGLERQRRIALRMKDITGNLLTLARADADGMELRREAVSPGGILTSMCEEFRLLARQNDITIRCELDEGVRVVGDPGFLGQLVQNLIGNALKFTPAGGRIDLSLGARNGDAVLSVADTGPGIPAEHRARIFERFHRVNEGRDQREGAGLGLAIVAWVARSHGGSVTVSSRPDGGAAFEVRLPLAPSPPVQRSFTRRSRSPGKIG